MFFPTQVVLNHRLLFLNRGVLLAVHLPLIWYLLMAHKKTYDPTIKDTFRKQLMVDNRMCFVELIDTAGQGKQLLTTSQCSHSQAEPFIEYATLRDECVRSVDFFFALHSFFSYLDISVRAKVSFLSTRSPPERLLND